MAKNRIADIVKNMAEPVAEELNYELVDVEFVKEGATWYLRLYIDKPGGITLDDCKAMNDKMDALLDEKDLISHAYTFEVCSPGLDRPLKTDRDFEKYKGELVEVNLFEAINGSKHHEGELLGRENGNISIKNDKGVINFPQEKVSVVKRVIQF